MHRSTPRRAAPIATIAILAAAVTLGAQALDRAGVDRQLGRIFEGAVYTPPAFGPARWLADGAAYTTVESAGPSGGSDIIR